MGKYIISSEITQKPPLCGLTFLTVDRLREREKAELTKGSGIVLSIESLSDSRAPKAVYRVVACSASPSVIRSHLRAWGMISRSSPSISALADFPTPQVSLVRLIDCPRDCRMGCPSASTPKYLAQIAATGVSVAGACATGIAAAGICDRCDGAARHIGPIRLSQDRPAQTGGELLPPAAAVPVSLRTARENWRPHCATQPTLGRSPTKPAAFP